MSVVTTELDVFLSTLFGADPDGSLIEVRARRGAGMRSWFVPDVSRDRLHEVLPRLGRRTDVYVGVAPRDRPDGTRRGVTRAHVAWADIDGPDGLARAAAFMPHPTLVVRSGSPGGAHAYWALEHPVDVATVEQLNRGLTEVLVGDPVWAATTILRVPGTFNHKHNPPRAVSLARATGELFDPDELLAALPVVATPAETTRRPRPAGRDRLLAVPPRDYVRVLLGVEVPRSGFVSCPFHRDRTPSLKVYDTPQRGWCCFGRCGRRGGTIYDLAAHLWRLETRGEDFLEVRRRLLEAFPER